MNKIAKVKYPSWFSQYNSPRKPNEPEKKTYKYEKISEIELSTYSYQPFVAPEADHVEINHVSFDGENSVDSVTIVFYKKLEIDNPDYEKECKKYKKDLSIFEVQSKEWSEYMKTIDDRDKEFRRKQYEKLKKEFGS